MRVLAASVDPIENVAELRAGLRVGYRMFGAIDVHAVAAATGAHIHEGDDGRAYTHATGFLVDPDGLIANAVYSTGPIGRFWASAVAAGSVFVYHGRRRAVLVNFPSRGELETILADSARIAPGSAS